MKEKDLASTALKRRGNTLVFTLNSIRGRPCPPQAKEGREKA